MTSLPSRADDPALWPSDPEEARALQARLAREIRQDPLDAAGVRLAAGLAVPYDRDDERLVAAAVELSLPQLGVAGPLTAGARRPLLPLPPRPVRLPGAAAAAGGRPRPLRRARRLRLRRLRAGPPAPVRARLPPRLAAGPARDRGRQVALRRPRRGARPGAG